MRRTQLKNQDVRQKTVHVSPLSILVTLSLLGSSTGSTGYIGGSILRSIVIKYAEFEITALLRTTPVDFEQCYPKIKIARGDFDNFNLIEKAAFEADIVIRMSRDINLCFLAPSDEIDKLGFNTICRCWGH